MKNESVSLEAQLTSWCTETFAAAFPECGEGGVQAAVGPARNEQFGDCQCETAMKLAKELKTSPRAVAQKFVETAVLPEAWRK